ncbi:MAG: hypothetical protein ABI456_04560 [Ktedonobacteraceae bacterium]|nr:hypothetical protein [Chloroflexota bacterium]
MTQSNRLATLLVLQHARYSPPFAVFQFGHEIRVARLHLFYLVLRWLGADIEAKVLADGTFQFDQFICSLNAAIHPDHAPEKQRPLWTDEEAIADILRSYPVDRPIAAMDVAERYTYPVKYVEEVLLGKIEAARRFT